MATQLKRPRRADAVVQFVVFTPNRLGRLHDLIGTLGTQGVHVLAMMILDTTDSAIIRFVADDPDRVRELLDKSAFPYSETKLVVVEANSDSLSRLMAVLLEAEINVNYLYPFLPHPRGRSVVALSMEDNEIAEETLRTHQFVTLRQADLSR